jgi:hypothetical protein
MLELDFFETPINPYTLLVDGTEVTIHVRNTETMEQGAVRGIVSRKLEALGAAGEGTEIAVLNCYGRLGVRLTDAWYMKVLEHMDDEALRTDHVLAQSLDIEQSLKSPEQFKKSRFRKDQET